MCFGCAVVLEAFGGWMTFNVIQPPKQLLLPPSLAADHVQGRTLPQQLM